MKELIEIGFKKVGEWELNNGVLICNLNNNYPSKNILYSFVCENDIKYIGKSVKSISQRLYGYRKPNKSQTTNYRINKLILEKLKNGIQIEIYLFVDNIGLNFREHKINLAAGLEDNLISEFLPKWNYLGKTIKKTKKTETKDKPNFENTNSRFIYNDNEFENNFVVALGKKYFNDGFFNVRVKHSSFFGKDLSKIKIQLGENPSNYCIGKVNRTANTNQTPRIFAGKEYKSWIQENFERGDLFHVKIIENDFIKLTKKRTPNNA
ncbi:MAG: hypothetical protein COA67_02070 [Lutibacter sp.]|nr:MAG: hypothetical protein COA67_02070 [Lutibacter sp.]